MQKGWQSSEFWVSIMGAAVGLYLIVMGVQKDKDLAIEVGAALFVGSGGAYAISRGISKIGTQTTPATPTPPPAG